MINNNKKANLFVIILAGILFSITMVALIINENSNSRNNEQLSKITNFTESKNRIDRIITDLMTIPDTSRAIAFTKSSDPNDMKEYCHVVFKEKKAEKLVYELRSRGITEQEECNLLRAKKFYDELTMAEVDSMRLIAESANIPEKDMPIQVRNVSLTEEEKNLSKNEQYDLGNNYLISKKYEKIRGEILDIFGELKSSLDSRFDDNVTKIIRDTKDDVAKVSNTFKVILLLQVVLFIGFFLLTQKQKKAVSEATKAKSEFLSRMSHDMRTPMNAIIGFSEISVDKNTTEEERRECCKKIQSSGNYMLGLINDILDMSKIEEDKLVLNLEPYLFKDFKEEIKTILLPQAEAKNIRLDITETKECYGAIEADKLRIKQVFVNLIGNAIKFTHEGGIVQCEMEAENLSDNYVSNNIIIRDNGIGMSKKFVENKLFKPFEQEHSNEIKNDNGTGLGLSIVKNIIETMGGTITCQSKLGEGTTFKIVFKAKIAKDIGNQQNDQDISLEILKGKKVLLCEDHQINVQIATKLLERENMNVVVAENGQIGVETFENSNINEYDLILMDIRMPVMNGLEATETIRSLNREDAKTIPIIAMTANAFLEDISKSFKVGMNGHLSKPINAKLMYQTIAKELLKLKK
ncbi:MAG: response regulator [Anaerovoracaceae bacterium]